MLRYSVRDICRMLQTELRTEIATLENLKSVMESFHISLNEAMEVLEPV